MRWFHKDKTPRRLGELLRNAIRRRTGVAIDLVAIALFVAIVVGITQVDLLLDVQHSVRRFSGKLREGGAI